MDLGLFNWERIIPTLGDIEVFSGYTVGFLVIRTLAVIGGLTVLRWALAGRKAKNNAK